MFSHAEKNAYFYQNSFMSHAYDFQTLLIAMLSINSPFRSSALPVHYAYSPGAMAALLFFGYCVPEYRYVFEGHLLIVFSFATGYYCWTQLACYDGTAIFLVVAYINLF